MPVGNAMAQLAHCCVQAGDSFVQPQKTPYIYILEVKDETELLSTVDRLKNHNINVDVFYEPDYPEGYTAAVTAPLTTDYRKFFKKYKLFSMNQYGI